MSDELSMKFLPEEERPYERFAKMGAAALTDAELLAIIIRTGVPGENTLALARRILNQPGTKRGILSLYDISLEELQKIRGIGRIKAMQLKCLGEISRRIAKTEAADQLDFSAPATIADYYMEDLRHKKQEQLMMLMLNTKNRLIGDVILSKGTVNASFISPREIFIEALHKEAVYIVLLHNHPSGDPTPSREDILVTKRVKEAGMMVGIQLLDHIIIGDNRYMSFHEQAIL